MSTRIYVVTDTGAQTFHGRLVRASTRAQALRHVVEPRFAVDVASQQTLVDLLGEGITVEDASESED